MIVRGSRPRCPCRHLLAGVEAAARRVRGVKMGCRSGRRCLEALAGLELRLAPTGLALARKAEIGCVAVTGV